MLIITAYIKQLEEEGTSTNQELGAVFGVSKSMISSYRTGSYNPSLDVAVRVFMEKGVTLHPYSEESLIYEEKKWHQ